MFLSPVGLILQREALRASSTSRGSGKSPGPSTGSSLLCGLKQISQLLNSCLKSEAQPACLQVAWQLLYAKTQQDNTPTGLYERQLQLNIRISEH